MSRSISPDSPNKSVIGVQFPKDPFGQKNINLAHQELVSFGIGITSEASKCRHLGNTEDSHTLLEAVKDHNNKMQPWLGYVQRTLNCHKVLENTYPRLSFPNKSWLMRILKGLIKLS